MRRVPIRLKLAAALSIPLLALGVVTVLEVLKSADEVAEIRSQTDLAEAAIGPSGLVSALQNERTWPAVDLVGQTGVVDMPVEGYEDTRAATDAALVAFEQLIESKGGSVRDAYREPLEQLTQIDQLRADIDANVAAVNPRTIDNNFAFSHEVFQRYSELIQPFFDATTRISLAIDDPELRQGTELADTATRQIEEMSLLLNGVMGDASSAGGIDTTAEIASSSVRLTRLENNAEILRNASGPYAPISAETFPAALTDRVVTNVREAVNNNNLDFAAVFADVNVPKEEGYIAMQEAIAAETVDRADSLNSAAEARQRWFIALAVLVLGTAIVLTWLVSRSITRPLKALTREAKEMAERRLPEAVIDILETPLGDDVVMPQITPVRLQTRDEVADVSDALNTVQDTALDLAVEQAVLRRNIADSFVNLGRRNQNLLGRQLDFITELETNETDADTLANLFRLDHLATRMRRNAESLLVLAGIEPPRKWAAPVRLTDVIRAALGEVEDYQRVTVRGVEPATILGSAAADLAHLMAELIENALVFSPPDQTVDIRGRNRPDGYTLAIIDSGLGMPPSDVAAANRRLAGAESFTIAPSKYLGHYVAGNLAARHDIHVHLDNSPGNGITATIDIPPALLTTDTALPQADEPHAAREVWPPTPSTNEIPPGAAPLPARRPTAPPAPLPQAGGDGYTQLPQPNPTRAVAFPRADFGDTGRVPVYSDDNPGVWADPAPAGGTGDGAEPPWFSAPAPAADAGPGPLGGGLARRQPANDAEAESRRTPSGLVKRSPRVVDTGEIQAVGLSADPDLLTSLSRFANPGQQVTGTAPVRQDHQRPTPTTPPAPRSPEAGAPPLPSRQQPPSGPARTATPPHSGEAPFPAPRSSPVTGPTTGAGAGVGLGGLAAGLSGLSPFQGASPGARDGAPAARRDVGAGDTGGLPRRVRGAQLPTTKPVQLRRASRPTDPGPAPAPSAPGGSPFGPAPSPSTFASPPPTPTAPAGTPGKQSADAVYSFLSSFTAGVQRGLDDSRPTGQPPA